MLPDKYYCLIPIRECRLWRLIDHSVLDKELIVLRDQFKQHHGDKFQLDHLTVPEFE